MSLLVEPKRIRNVTGVNWFGNKLKPKCFNYGDTMSKIKNEIPRKFLSNKHGQNIGIVCLKK